MFSPFYQELAKIGAAKKKPKARPKGYAASVLAHELGHAQDFEGRSLPKLRRSVETGVAIGGTLGSLGAAIAGRPGTAALLQMGSTVPTLLDEARASFRGVRALERDGRFSAEEKKKMRKHLYAAGGTYLAQAGISTGMMAGLGELRRVGAFDGKVKPGRIIAGAAGLVALPLLSRWAQKSFKESSKQVPILTDRNATRLRKDMKVRAQIYEGKNLKGNAMYIPGQTVSGPVSRDALRNVLPKLLKKKGKTTVNTILREGGVVQGRDSITRKRDLERAW